MASDICRSMRLKIFKNCFFLILNFVVVEVGNSRDIYSEKIQPIFNNRCIACHSCYDAPCQLNLQDHSGFTRGASKELVYNGFRLMSATPTRLWIDAFTEAGWRKKSFFTVNNSQKASESIFYQTLVQKKQELMPQEVVKSSNSCPSNQGELKDFLKSHPQKAMPYGLPRLNDKQLGDIKNWIEQGAPGPQIDSSKDHPYQLEIKIWENFLNKKDDEHKLVARYMYEHLFLAHISFSEERTQFFRLVRTALPCNQNGQEINTRTPNEDPKTKELYYCFRPQPGTIVAKTHIPIVLSGKKFKRYQEIFFKEEWKVSKLPTYDRQVSANPFVAFKDIPTKARYEYLLEDARFHINTFIKGPVCNGSAAVNSIQEQFFVSFIAPEADVMLLSRTFEKKSREDLLLPGIYGSDVRVNKTPVLMRELTSKREKFRLLKKNWLKKTRPLGYSYADIWKGSEGFLTVFRHDDNAAVLYGYVGDVSKTLFFLDYSLFERLVYNLVVNFDVYGNIGHQTLTRIYMDLIRMEAEENFLAFLPPEQRKPIRDSWYKGYLTKLKMDYIFPDVLDDIPVNIKYQNSQNAKQEFVEKISKGKNTRQFFPESISRPGKNNVANYFPELTFVRVDGKASRVFSIVRNREHENVSWILAEEYRLSPEEDSLSLVNGFAGAYPNLFLIVSESHLEKFIAQIKDLKSLKEFDSFVAKYTVRRNDPKFWELYDSMNDIFLKHDSLEAGFLDLTRYELKQ